VGTWLRFRIRILPCVKTCRKLYLAYYVEGRGFFAPKRVWFGLTGTPSMFAHVTADKIGNFLAKLEIELLIDDGGMAGDNFEDMMACLLEDDKLWHLGGSTLLHAVYQQECVTKLEAMELARQEHAKLHMHCDVIQMQLLYKICSPFLDTSITNVILECGHCKNFRRAMDDRTRAINVGWI
jgi:hypothetical protein